MADKVLIQNFMRPEWFGRTELLESDLGWGEIMITAAMTDDPEKIFRFAVEEVGYNVLFFWVKTQEWYTIDLEKFPIEVRQIDPNPNWDGKWVFNKSGFNGVPHTNYAGKILATFEEPTEIYDNLKIEGVPIGEVLLNSLITDLD